MEAGSLILSEPLGAGDVILVTGSGNCSPLVFDEHHRCPDHEVSICRRDYAVFKFNEIDDWVHAKMVCLSPDSVNRKLYLKPFTIFLSGAR